MNITLQSKHYWMYKDDAKAASDYALSRDKEALYRLCAKQVYQPSPILFIFSVGFSLE